MKTILKQTVGIIALAVAVFSGMSAVYAETAENVRLVYSGETEPDTYVSFMVIKSGSFSELKAGDVYNTEIVKSDSLGKYTYSIALENVNRDSEGRITNYKLNSSIKTLNINSGIQDDTIGVRIDGNVIDFKTPPFINGDGTVFVPIAETFEKLGVPLIYDEENKTYTGKGNNGEIIITVGKDTAEIDWVDVEMPAASQNINGVDMIPLYIIEDALKTDAPVYNSRNAEISIKKPKPDSGGEDEFDIEKVVSTLPEGSVIMSNEGFLKRLGSMPNGAEYVDTAVNNGTLTVTTYRDKYGYIPDEKRALEIPSWASNDFNKGETGLISFEIRALSSEDESGCANITVMYQRSKDWIKALYEEVSIPVGNGWKKMYFPVYDKYYDMKKEQGAHFMLQVGGKPMCIEIRNFSFVNYGTEVPIEKLRPSVKKLYKGAEDDALWRKEAYRRIEKYRKNDLDISVVDGNGNPVEGAEISVDMTENEFMFGVALCENEVLDLDLSTKSGAIYDDLINNSFNTGVCGMEMKQLYVVEDDATAGIKMINEFLERGKRARGHAIYWDGLHSLTEADPDTATYDVWYKDGVEYARNIAQTFKGRLAQWDVLNEPTQSANVRSKFNSTRMYSDIFKEVRKVDPSVKLYVNETAMQGKNDKNTTDLTPSFFSIIRQMQREGAPIDGIGIQGHCTQYLYPQGFYHQIDDCASLVDEIAVTEYDFMNENMDYADKHLRDTLLATFSHPKATAFVIWGVQDAMHWRNLAPFYDYDWNARPALEMWNRMVSDEFATHEKTVTNHNGKAVVRGFRGNYSVKCKVDDKEYIIPCKLSKDGKNKVVFTVENGGISAYVSENPEDVPEPVGYRNIIDAQRDFESENPISYNVEVFNTCFHREGGIENTAVMDGSATDSDAFENGRAWASRLGVADFVSHSIDGVYIKSTDKSYGADLRHKMSLESIPFDADVVFEFLFDTLDGMTSGSFDAEIALKGQENQEVGALTAQVNGYLFKTADGTVIGLNANTEYTLSVSFIKKGDTYGIKYDFCDRYGNVKESYTDVTVYKNILSANEVLFNMSSAGGKGENLFRFWSIGMRGIFDGEVVSYEKTKESSTVLDESMRNFDLSDAEYMGNKVADRPTDGITENKWGIYSSTNPTNAFAYSAYRHYLYAVRNEPSGENILAKTFRPISSGDALTLEYNMYINCSSKWYDSPGSAVLSLGSSDKSTNLDVTAFGYSGYAGFWIKVLGEEQDIVYYTKSDWNWVDLTVTLKLVPNSTGNYDARVTVTNGYGFKYERNVENVLTAAEAEQLSALYILSKTDYDGTRYNANLCGFKNISINTTTAEFIEKNGAVYCGRNINRYEIPYENVTNGIKEVYVLLAEYKDNVLINTRVIPFELEKGCGKLMFDSGTSADSDSVKVFLIEDINTVRPLKNADTLIITD